MSKVIKAPICWKCLHSEFIEVEAMGRMHMEFVRCNNDTTIKDYDDACKRCPILKELEKALTL